MIDLSIAAGLGILTGGVISSAVMAYFQSVDIKRIRGANRAERKRLEAINADQWDSINADQWDSINAANVARWDAEMKLVVIKAQKTRGPDGRFTSKTRAKSIAMAQEMGRADLVKRLEGLAK